MLKFEVQGNSKIESSSSVKTEGEPIVMCLRQRVKHSNTFPHKARIS